MINYLRYNQNVKFKIMDKNVSKILTLLKF